MRALRWTLGGCGVLLALFGGYRLLTEIPLVEVGSLGVWLAVALVLHDGVLAPFTIAVGASLERIPARARRHLQGALVTGVGVSAIASPLIVRENSQPASKALLRQDYAVHLGWLWMAIGVAAGTLYLIRVARDRGAGSTADQRSERPST